MFSPHKIHGQSQDIDDNAPEISYDETEIEIFENGNLDDLTGVYVTDLDFEYAFSSYTITIE